MRKNIIIFTTIIVFYTTSCNENTFIEKIERKVYNDVFINLIDIDFYYMPTPIPKIKSKTSDSEDSISVKKHKMKYNSLFDKYKEKIDTIKKFLFISDSLVPLKFNINELYTIIPETKVEYKKIIETLPQYVKNSIKLNKNSIIINKNIKLIEKKFNNKDELFNAIGEKNGELYLGKIELSRIAFNSNYTKGLFLFTFICGGKCGEQSCVLVYKNKNKWVIDEKIKLIIF